VSLKHAGAAFAARDSLQEITLACLRSRNAELQRIPQQWANRLLEEVCLSEKVRDSTLRRSTGYALGFLALMRSELASKPANSGLCERLLKNLVVYSLPPENEFKRRLSALGVLQGDSDRLSTIFHACANSDERFLLHDSIYEVGD